MMTDKTEILPVIHHVSPSRVSQSTTDRECIIIFEAGVMDLEELGESSERLSVKSRDHNASLEVLIRQYWCIRTGILHHSTSRLSSWGKKVKPMGCPISKKENDHDTAGSGHGRFIFGAPDEVC